jgi:hypothetical protein
MGTYYIMDILLTDVLYYIQTVIIKECLGTHEKLVSTEMRPFHTTLTECKKIKKRHGHL